MENENTINQKFNDALKTLTPNNANSVILSLGHPSKILRSTDIADKEIRLYGNKVMKKVRKHGLDPTDLQDLPKAVNNPIAVFEGAYSGSRAILTDLKIKDYNVLATLVVGKGEDICFNIVTSAYPKMKDGVVGWINNGKLLYANKEKALDYLRAPALPAGATNNQGLKTAVKTVTDFVNPEPPTLII